jgi:DNA-directed RNA polymerase subunit M/transcription elongation factor TFIIS
MAAELITIKCPNCQKLLRAPASAVGKKIRCKACEHVFAITGGPSSAPAPPPPPKPALAPAARSDDDDDEDSGGSYGVIDEKLGARCPHCASAMEEEQRICLECGYDTLSRRRFESKKTYDITEADYAKWLLPGFLCLFGMFAIIGLDVFLVFSYPGWIKSTFELTEDQPYFNPCSLWTVIISMFGIVPCFVFALRRLILNPTPPEVIKKDVKE